MTSLPAAQITALKLFINICKANPEIVHHPDLAFFKEYIESLGGKAPELTNKTDNSSEPKVNPEPKVTPQPEVIESEESDVELDNDGCVSADGEDQEQHMGDKDKEVSEEDIEKSNDKKRDALNHFGEGNYVEAIKSYTEAIKLNPNSALLHAKRGQCYLMLKKPNACIKDCNRALEINPDSATAYKFRGRAHRLLGNWIEAASDLRTACKIDFDEQADEWLKEVTPNASKIEAHQRKYERKRLEKELEIRRERVRRMQEAQEKRRAEEAEAQRDGGAEDSFDMGGAGGMGDFLNIMNDPELLQAFKDPQVAAAFQDISSNPANILKYQNNPKIAAILAKLSSKFGGTGGFPGGAGFPGFGGASGPGPADDVGFASVPPTGPAAADNVKKTAERQSGDDLDLD